MLLALTTGHKVGLAGAAAAFIVFSLVSAFLLPRRNPDFPGARGRNWFIVVTVAIFVAMLFAVELFGGEEEQAEGEAATVTQTETTGTAPTTTSPEPAGDAAAGKSLFTAQGCSGCHALAAANAAGSIGPDLDETLDGKDAAFVKEAIVEPNADIADGYSPGLMPQDFGEKLSDKQVDDLVALLTPG